MEKNNPLVSVVVRTFNQSDIFLSDTLNSVLQQTYTNLELLISDDSNSKNSIDFIDNIGKCDDRVRVIRKSERMGLVGAMNEALKTSKGDYIAVLDADDIAHKDRIERQVQYLQSHPEIDVLGSAMNIINEKGEITATRHYPLGGVKLLEWAVARNPIGHPTVMFKSEIIKRGLFYDERMAGGSEDLEFWLRLRNLGYKISNMEDVLVDFRVCEDMGIRRKKNNKQNLKARLYNFSYKYLFYDVQSLWIILLRSCTPNSLISWLYSKETKQKYK